MTTSEPYYDDGRIVIFHGDWRDHDGWLAGDLLATDPPYGIGWSRGENKARSSAAHAGIRNDEDTSERDAALERWKGPALVFGSFYAPFPADVRHVLVWRKPNDAGVVGSTTGYRRDVEPIFLIGPWPTQAAQWSSVVTSTITNIGSPNSPAGRTGHPHAKPVDLMRDLIIRADVAGTIVDPFMGVGRDPTSSEGPRPPRRRHRARREVLRASRARARPGGPLP